MHICDALRDLVPFVEVKNREKHPWRSVTFSKVADFFISIPPENVKKPRGFLTFSGGIEMEKPVTLLKVHPSMGVFHGFKIVQMAANCANYLIYACWKLFFLYSAKISRSWKTDPKVTRPVIINELIDTNLPQYVLGPGGEKNTQVGCCWNAGPLHFDGIKHLWLLFWESDSLKYSYNE